MLAQVFQDLGAATGLAIAEVATPQGPAEAYLVFTDDPLAAAAAPAVQRFFRDPRESDDQFAARFSYQLRHGSVGTMGLNDRGIATLIEIFYSPASLPEAAPDIVRDVRLAQIAFKAVTRAQPSDVLPSLMNPDSDSPTLTPIDIAFLQALQAPSVTFKMPTAEAIQEIARLMVAALR